MPEKSNSRVKNHQVLEQAAEEIQRAKQEILTRWENIVREEWINARVQSRPQLRDSLPQFIDGLVEALRSPVPWANRDHKLEVAAAEHAQERVEQQHYSIQHVVREYEILRRLIFGHL